VADPAYQARAQSFTSMAFTLSFPLGSLWGGLAIDRFGVRALLGGAGVLVLIAVAALLAARGSRESLAGATHAESDDGRQTTDE
jgi:predicted MFS family arabinose efflux permease